MARGINKKGVAEAIASQLSALQTELNDATTQLVDDRKDAKNTTNKEYVKGLVTRTSNLATVSGNLCKMCEAVTTETQQVLLFKSIGLAATTLRDSLFLMVDTLAEVPAEWQDPLSESFYYGAAKVVEKSLAHLLNSKAVALGDNVIPRGELAEITATCGAAVSALTKIVYAFDESDKCPTPLEFVFRIKIAANVFSQLSASMNAAISKSDLGISHTLLKDSLTEALEQLKSSFAQMLQQSRRVFSSLAPERRSDCEKIVEKPKEAVIHLLSCALSLSEVNISEVKNSACKPSQTDIEAAQKIVTGAMPDRPAQRPAEESAKEYLDGGNVWDDGPDTEENTTLTDGKLKMASFNKIIEKMTSHDAERDMLLKTFVLTHTSVTTPEAFLDKLLQRFEVPPDKSIERTAVQARVCNTLQVWMANHFDMLPVDVIDQVERLTESLKSDPALKGWATRMTSLINRKRSEAEEEEERQFGVRLEDLEAVATDQPMMLNPAKVLLVFSEEEIAKQLTLIDFGIYVKIRVSELLDQAWSKAKYKYRARNIAKLIARSNDVTLWVCSLIVWPKTLKERVRNLTKVIEIAHGLQKLNNFNSLVSFMSALNNSAVHRLKHTFDSLSDETNRQLNELKEATKVDGNRKNYRAALAKVKKKKKKKKSFFFFFSFSATKVDGPCIPFIGVTLTDITFMDDANASFGRGGLINVSKFEKLHGMVSDLLSFQQNTYQDIVFNEQLSNFLVELPHNSEDDLFKLSLLREPRGAEKSALA